MSKNNLELYNKYVHRAKDLLSTIKSYQIEIVKMVLEVCDIRHGGISPHVFTVKRFALDIGMNPKTLQNWVREYRNVALKLTKEDQLKLKSDEDWKKIRRTNKLIDNDTSIEQVRKIFATESQAPSFSIEILNAIAAQKHLKHCLKKRDLSLIKDSTWSTLMELMDGNFDKLKALCDLIDENSDNINNYLTNKNRRVRTSGQFQTYCTR